MKKLIAGNWKMNGNRAAAAALTRDVIDGIDAHPELLKKCDFLICPPFLHLSLTGDLIRGGDSPLALGGQDCALTGDGAYTGDVSAVMLKDMDCNYVILGHSERRQYHAETDETVAAKAAKAHEAGLIAIICVGEKESERAAGFETEVVARQLKKSIPASAKATNTVIAYEPVWAIGTGKTASVDDVRVMHGFIRDKLKEQLADSANMRILYGGSVKPDNAQALFAVPHVDGGLIGGASLKADQFLGIAKAAV